ncbi:MAG: penicillin-insensitive murein endopeptidase [Alphaproteobacteria bacterium]|nr:penicillin-insensitive murein endopeptidase [Alphaproteobacteria bacterium]
MTALSKPARNALITVALLAALAACGPVGEVNAPPRPPVVGDKDGNPPAAEQFAAVATPTSGAPQVFGSYTRGCIAGAERLPTDTPHWQVLNPSRNRAWGHPALLAFVRTLADNIAADGYRGLLIGDLAQPRGGPLPSDHNSHQVGLDADIWLTPLPQRRFAPPELETYEPLSMVDLPRLTVMADRFGAAQVAILKRAAEAPDVERIFVSPPIKQALCKRTAPGARAWLRKIRPWRGHTSHMHVRLACPTNSMDCKPQEPPPEGDGCGEELQSWFKDTSWTIQGSTPYQPETALKLEALPTQCQKLLTVERG